MLRDIFGIFFPIVVSYLGVLELVFTVKKIFHVLQNHANQFGRCADSIEETKKLQNQLKMAIEQVNTIESENHSTLIDNLLENNEVRENFSKIDFLRNGMHRTTSVTADADLDILEKRTLNTPLVTNPLPVYQSSTLCADKANFRDLISLNDAASVNSSSDNDTKQNKVHLDAATQCENLGQDDNVSLKDEETQWDETTNDLHDQSNYFYVEKAIHNKQEHRKSKSNQIISAAERLSDNDMDDHFIRQSKYLVTTQTDHKAEISLAVDQDFDVIYSTTDQNTFLNEIEDHQIDYESNATKYIGEHISSNQKFELTNDIIRIDNSNINELNSKQVEIEGKFGGPQEIGILALDKQNSLRLTVNHLENAQPETRRSHMNANGDLAKYQKDIMEVLIESQYEPELNSKIEASPRKMSPKKYKNTSMDVTAFTSSADPFKNTSINVPYLESRHNKVNPHKLSDFSDVSPKLSKACKIKSKISPLQPSLHSNQIIPNNTERQGNSNELEGLSDFYDFNAMLNGAAYGYNGTFEPTQLQWRSTDFLHGHSKNNPSSNETTIMQKSLTDSRFSPVDERKHTYAKQVSVADFSDYADYFDDLREKAKHFRRSRSQSRSIGSSFESQLDHREWDIHQSEPVKPTKGFGSLSSRELTPEPYLNSKIFMKSRTISTDDKMLDFLEGDEYHHYRRHSLFQQHQPDIFSHDDYDDSTVAEARTSAQPGYLVLTVETPQTLHRSVSEICTRSIDHFLESQSQDSCNTFCQSHCDLEKN